MRRAGAPGPDPAPALAAIGLAIAMLVAVQTAKADAPVALGGVTLGSPVLDVVKEFGAPGLVATTDDGLEWRWFDAKGLDLDLLADDSLVVRQILAGRPEPVRGTPAPLVQPREFPVLEARASAADREMRSAGALHLVEPEGTISAWRVGSAVVVLELRDASVRRILALDEASAARLGYVAGPHAQPYHAPRLLGQYAVDYPKRAIERHAEGVVVVEVQIAASGSVKDVRVLVPSGDADIDAAEVLSMRRSRFAPARCDTQACDGVYLDREEYTLAP